MAPIIHPLADVQSRNIGDGTKVWQFTVILAAAKVGRDCNICSHCFLEDGVRIGDRVTIKNGVYLWDGMQIGDDVFIGPNVTFTNDRYPKSKNINFKLERTIIGNRVSIGAGAIFLPGISIGDDAIIGAGSLVTKNVPSGSLVMGNPAQVKGDTNNVNR